MHWYKMRKLACSEVVVVKKILIKTECESMM